MVTLLVILTLLLAAANGGNDVSKGIATLFGSGVSKYRSAVVWGTIWTVAGALVASITSQGLVKTFNGNAFLSQPILAPAFLVAVAAGAIAWLVIATSTGLPVSTTHSLVGALIGASIAGQGLAAVTWATLVPRVILPLLLSPLASLLLVLVLLPLFTLAFQRFNRYCVCVEQSTPVIAAPNGVAVREIISGPVVEAGGNCSSETVVRLNLLDSLHWLTAGATSFFRGLNDTPKIVALGIAAAPTLGISSSAFYAAAGVAMGAGSLIAGFRVTQTLAKKVTPVTPANGAAANLVTSLFVGLASQFALPVSTTHVSSGAILGIGLGEDPRRVRWKVVGEILLAWVVTLPVSALAAAGAFALMH